MRLLLGGLVYLITLVVVLAAVGFWWAADEFEQPGPLKETVLFEIPKGASLNEIAADLEAESVIEHAWIFIFGTRILGAQAGLKAGEYEFTPGMNAYSVMDKIRNGDTVGRRITIREGLTSYEVVEILKEVKELEGEIAEIPEEGSLLPDTYDYRKGEAREEVLKRMEKSMRRQMFHQCGWLHDALDWDSIDKMSFDEYAASECPEDIEKKRFDGMDPTMLNVLILASIVEKETGVPEERKRVAGVFINRLRQGIALQTDPTVIYGITMGKHKNDGLGPLGRRLLKKDLETESPYNTYLHPGLPPGPIANPGRASIEAVLHPEEHNFIYFVADGTGGHVFAATLGEHNSNVAQWQKIRRENEKREKEKN